MLRKTSSSMMPIEANGAEIKYTQQPFKNWGGTVESVPAYTFYPKTKLGIQNIVKWTHKERKRLRAVGFRHTWTHLYVHDGDVLISLKSQEKLLTPSILDKTNELEHIELVGKPFFEGGKIKHLCKIGAATSNEQFRFWTINRFKQGMESCWTFPLNVILVENTHAGTGSLMCHGAGVRNPTLSDLITEIEFVNANGELQTVGYKLEDPAEKKLEGQTLIKSAGGALGLLGPVTAITYKLDLMTHAKMHLIAKPLALTVPPPPGFVIHKTLPEKIFKGITPDEFKSAQEDFVKRCEEDDYSEWFWFSLHNQGLINTFKNNGAAKDSKDYPGKIPIVIQELEQYIANLMNKTLMHLLPEKLQAQLLSEAAMLFLPTGKEMIMPLPDALHFRRGIDEMPVKDMEFEIPIPLLPDGKPDWSICQRAWWDAVIVVYEWLEKKGKVPMRLPLEMRVMSGSEMTMAPQKGNVGGTCAIEVLTVGSGLVDDKDWHEFMQAITEKWASYTDFSGKPLNVRPHWAKQSEGLSIQRFGEPRYDMWNYLKEVAYKDAIPVFKSDLSKIAEKGGYTIEAMKMFSNPLLDFLIYEEKAPVKATTPSEEKTPIEETKSEKSSALVESLPLPPPLLRQPAMFYSPARPVIKSDLAHPEIKKIFELREKAHSAYEKRYTHCPSRLFRSPSLEECKAKSESKSPMKEVEKVEPSKGWCC